MDPPTIHGRPVSGLLLPYGSKVPKYRVFRVSILGIVSMVLGIYFIVGHLDP